MKIKLDPQQQKEYRSLYIAIVKCRSILERAGIKIDDLTKALMELPKVRFEDLLGIELIDCANCTNKTVLIQFPVHYHLSGIFYFECLSCGSQFDDTYEPETYPYPLEEIKE